MEMRLLFKYYPQIRSVSSFFGLCFLDVNVFAIECINMKFFFHFILFDLVWFVKPRDCIDEYSMSSMTNQCNQRLIDDRIFCGLSIIHR